MLVNGADAPLALPDEVTDGVEPPLQAASERAIPKVESRNDRGFTNLLHAAKS